MRLIAAMAVTRQATAGVDRTRLASVVASSFSAFVAMLGSTSTTSAVTVVE